MSHCSYSKYSEYLAARPVRTRLTVPVAFKGIWKYLTLKPGKFFSSLVTNISSITFPEEVKERGSLGFIYPHFLYTETNMLNISLI